MGFSWSFYIVQQLHEQITLDSLRLSWSSLVLDAGPSPVLGGSNESAMPYCDNVHILSRDVGETQRCSVQNFGKQVLKFTRRRQQLQLCKPWAVLWMRGRGWSYRRRATAFGARYDHLCFAAGKYVRVQGPACRRLGRMPLWDSARRECLNFLSITPLLVEDFTRVWSQR